MDLTNLDSQNTARIHIDSQNTQQEPTFRLLWWEIYISCGGENRKISLHRLLAQIFQKN